MEEKKQTVYFGDYGEKRSACQYYRLEIPARKIFDLELALTWRDTAEHPKEATTNGMLHADFDVWWGTSGQDTLDMYKILTDIPITNTDEGIKVPPTLIFDIDDNRDYLHPHNAPGFVTGGIREYPSNKLLKPGAILVTPDPITGEEKILWQDKITWYGPHLFDISKNLHETAVMHKIFKLVHGMTTPSPVLAKYLREVIGVKHVHVFPNTIIPEDYPSYPLIPRNNLRILWQGGCSHFIDWYPLRDAFKQICRDNPDITIVIFGQLDDWVKEYIPANQLEFHPWIEYSAYKMKRALLQTHINLCPLADNIFNRCKSGIKFYEASIWDKPEVTLASNVQPYSDEIIDGETGLLYNNSDDFVQKLTILINNPDLRNTLAQNAKKWILTYRTPEATVPDLFNFYKSLQDERIGEFLLRK